MYWDSQLTPSFHLRLAELEGSFALPKKYLQELQSIGAEGGTAKLLSYLATKLLSQPLPAGLSFWRDFAKRYYVALRQVTLRDSNAVTELPTTVQVSQWLKDAPLFEGSEYLNEEVLIRFWDELNRWVIKEAQRFQGNVAELLVEQNPSWKNVGRVTFHLAENAQDPQWPFAFLATYSHGLSAQGELQHAPLGKAFQLFAGTQQRGALASLLLPIQRAAKVSDFVKSLLESRQIFAPQAWTSANAYQFLKAVPEMESAGIFVRVPDWWKQKKAPRPQVEVEVGEKPQGGVGIQAMMSFRVSVSLDGEELNPEEWEQLMQSVDGLVALRGKWVELDREKLDQTLKRWRALERVSAQYGVSFSQAMRIMSGASQWFTDPEEAEEIASWTHVKVGTHFEGFIRGVQKALVQSDSTYPVKATLRSYQQQGVEWLLFHARMGLGACLADDMGLGKTIQVITMLAERKLKGELDGASLLVCPASLMQNWEVEIQKFAPQLKVVCLHASRLSSQAIAKLLTHARESFKDIDLVITTYGLCSRLHGLKDYVWEHVVLDEAQAIKTPSSLQTKSVKQLQSKARIALTGTPVENRLTDLWSIFDFLMPDLLGRLNDFSTAVKRMTKQSHFAPLRELVSPYLLRRLKSDKSIIADLPDKIEVNTYCGLSHEQAGLYQQAVKELARRLKEEGDEEEQRRALVLSFLMRFKQICNHPSQWLKDHEFVLEASGKFLRLAELCREIANRQEKVLVFTQFQEMTEPLHTLLETIFKRSGLVLHGGTAVSDRQMLVSAFQSEGGPPFFVLSLKAGGTGLTLTAASHVIHFDRWWNPAVENQATDRAYRIGQKKNVMVHRFVTQGTIEEKIDSLLERKKTLADDVLSLEQRLDLHRMSNAELMEMFSLDHRSLELEDDES